jgi:hypothetical protein
MKSWSFLICLLLMSSISMAQAPVPGYQGRKVSLTTNFSFFGTYNQPNTNWFSGLTSFNTRLGAQLNIARAKDTERSISYDFLETKLIVSVRDPQLLDNSEQDVRASMTAHFIGVNERFYFGNYVAPLGHYAEYGVGFVHSVVTDVDDDFDLLFDTEEDSYVVNHGFLQLTFGNQNIWFDRLLTDVSVQGIYVGATDFLNPSSIATGSMIDDAKKRVRDHVNINVSVGVGILF